MVERSTALQFLRFGIVGVGNTATTLLVVWLLHSQARLPVWQASAIGYAVGTMQSYFLNRLWTFSTEAAGTRIAPQATAFVAVNIVCGLVFTALNAGLATLMPLAVATLLTLVVIVPLSFGLNRWLVFRSGKRSEAA